MEGAGWCRFICTMVSPRSMCLDTVSRCVVLCKEGVEHFGSRIYLEDEAFRGVSLMSNNPDPNMT